MDFLKILFASSEAVPFAKTGGLADVAGSLPKALKRAGLDIRVVIPKYKSIPQKYVDMMEYLGYVYVDLGWRHQYCGIFMLEYDGVTFYFIDNEYYFKRDWLYGHYDEAEQYVFFCKSILQILERIDFKPDIIHCNDWQAGVVSLLLKAHYRSMNFYKDIKTVFTIHNLRYQGIFSKEIMTELLGIGWEYFTPDGIEFYDCVNFMKAGLVYSDFISTVSKTYAEEIKTSEFGENLNGIIVKRSHNLYGIVNGIDYVENDPALDNRLYANYSVDNLEGKYINKRMLQEDLHLPVNDEIPVIGIISRLVAQKGFDLIDYVLDNLLMEDIHLVVLGTGEYRYEEMFKHAATKYPQKVAAMIKYDSILAQRIYAGSDMFLMPSLFEPCGLSQLFSLRYGTIPIVRETGGLSDTIMGFDETSNEGYGFTFKNYNAHEMLSTIIHAVNTYSNRDLWKSLIKRAMKLDFSWDNSATQYVEMYNKISEKITQEGRP